MTLPDKANLMEPSLEPWNPQGPLDRQIVVLMSGGVDSSVTAHLLRQAGWEVLGITMKIPTCTTQSRGCCGADAAFVCSELGLCHYFVDVTSAFSARIITPFKVAYQNGCTPNPCIDCNTDLKFSLVWKVVREAFGVQHLATGHYARVSHTVAGVRLRRGQDLGKDQSYFLYGIDRKRLPYLHLPLGDYEKSYTRQVASEIGLCVAQKPESMELCFAGEADYRMALDQEQRHHPGPLTDMSGRVIGEHQGVANYTLGQRRGLGFAGGQPLYVGRIDPTDNTVALGTRDEVCTRRVVAEQINVLIPAALKTGQAIAGKIRSYGPPLPCTLIDGNEQRIVVEFDQAIFAPCPGQRLVLYDQDECIIAGGTIVLDRAD